MDATLTSCERRSQLRLSQRKSFKRRVERGGDNDDFEGQEGHFNEKMEVHTETNNQRHKKERNGERWREMKRVRGSR